MAGQNEISQQKLERRRRELRARKHSFIELIMQVKKKIHKAEMTRRREETARRRAKRKSLCDAAGED